MELSATTNTAVDIMTKTTANEISAILGASYSLWSVHPTSFIDKTSRAKYRATCQLATGAGFLFEALDESGPKFSHQIYFPISPMTSRGRCFKEVHSCCWVGCCLLSSATPPRIFLVQASKWCVGGKRVLYSETRMLMDGFNFLGHLHLSLGG